MYVPYLRGNEICKKPRKYTWIARILLPAVTFTIFKAFRCSSYQSLEHSDGDDGDPSFIVEWYLTVDHSILCGVSDDNGFTASNIYKVTVCFEV